MIGVFLYRRHQSIRKDDCLVWHSTIRCTLVENELLTTPSAGSTDCLPSNPFSALLRKRDGLQNKWASILRIITIYIM